MGLAILVYADDVLLMAPTVSSVQLLFSLNCKELKSSGIEVNYKKSECMRIGPRFMDYCSDSVSGNDHALEWALGSNAITLDTHCDRLDGQVQLY
jgi:hypothetical protein